jgi:hypothetical protein
MRAKAVTSSGANRSRRNTTESKSASVVMIGRTSYGERSRSGSAERKGRWSAAPASTPGPANRPTMRLAKSTAAVSSSTTTSITPLAAITSDGPNCSGV